MAVITVNDAAENKIIVVSGANNIMGREDMVRLEAALNARVLLLQLEAPLDAVVAAAEMGRPRRGGDPRSCAGPTSAGRSTPPSRS